MNEQEWLTCTDPDELLKNLSTILRKCGIDNKPALTRRRRLLSVAACRRLGDSITGVWLEAMGLAERYADSNDKSDLRDAQHASALADELWTRQLRVTPGRQTVEEEIRYWVQLDVNRAIGRLVGSLASRTVDALYWAAWAVGRQESILSASRLQTPRDYLGVEHSPSLNERAAQAALLRDIFGNPFRPVAFSPAWRSESAAALARTMYDTRNFSPMPVLADALEEAGCDSPDVLAHCRDPQQVHVRGCWVVDLVLGKS